MVRRHEHVLDPHAVGAAGAHAEHAVAAPVVEDRVLAARHHGVAGLRRLTFAPDHPADDAVGRVGNAGAIVPGAVDDVAAVDRRQRPERRRTVRRDEMTLGTEQFELRLLRPQRGDLERMRRGQRQAPADARMPARNLQHHAVECREIELVAAEQARLGDAIEPRLQECLVQLFAVGAARIVLVLLRAQERPQRHCPRHQLGRREPRLGRRYDRPSQGRNLRHPWVLPRWSIFRKSGHRLSARECDHVQIIETAFRPDSGLDERHAIGGPDEGQRTALGAGADLQ